MTEHAEIAAEPPEVLATFRAAPSAEGDAQWRELIDADRGYDVVRNLDERVRKLYMSLNAEARGDKVDIEGDPVAKWNHLVEATATVLTYAVAQGRWAVLEHRRADAAEAEVATLREALGDADRDDIAAILMAHWGVDQADEGAYDTACGDFDAITRAEFRIVNRATPTATAGVLDSLIEHERWNSGRVDPTATAREGDEE